MASALQKCTLTPFDKDSVALWTTKPRKFTVFKATSSTAILRYADLKRREYENILTALEQARWKVYGARGAAELLDINPTTLASRMQAFGLKRAR